MRPYILNPDGFSLTPTDLVWGGRAVFRVRLSEMLPLTYIDEHGDAWQPNKDFLSDGWSIPGCLGWIAKWLNPWRWRAGLFHDSACREHAHTGHGLWFLRDGAAVWTFVPMTVEQAADKLRDIMLAEGAWHWLARLARALVIRFGPQWDIVPA